MQSASQATSGPFQGSTCAHLSSYNRFTLDDMPACRPKQWTCSVQTSQFEPLKNDFHFKEKVLITNARNGIVDMFLRSQKDKWQKTSKIFFTKKKFSNWTELNLNWKWKLNLLDAGASGQEWIGRMSLKEWISRLTAMDHNGNGWMMMRNCKILPIQFKLLAVTKYINFVFNLSRSIFMRKKK